MHGNVGSLLTVRSHCDKITTGTNISNMYLLNEQICRTLQKTASSEARIVSEFYDAHKNIVLFLCKMSVVLIIVNCAHYVV